MLQRVALSFEYFLVLQCVQVSVLCNACVLRLLVSFPYYKVFFTCDVESCPFFGLRPNHWSLFAYDVGLFLLMTQVSF